MSGREVICIMLFRSQGLISVDVVHYLSVGNHFRAAVLHYCGRDNGQ